MSFVFTIDTALGDGLNQFTLPCSNVGVFNATIDWGDGGATSAITSFNDVDLAHTYAAGGIYTVTVTGVLPAVYFFNAVDMLKLTSVLDIGDVGWMSFSNAFRGCVNLVSFGSATANTTNVTNMGYMFYNCGGLTVLDVTGFVTTNVTNMYAMFYNCGGLTVLDVTGFVTTNVTNMGYMFYNCGGLTVLDVTGFDVSNVTDGTNFLLSANNAIDQAEYELILATWSTQAVQPNVTWHFGNTPYSNNAVTELHPKSIINGQSTYIDLQAYATAQVVPAGGRRYDGGRYYSTALGGTTDFNDPLNLSNDGNMLITGNSIKKVSGIQDWNAAVSSNNNFTGEAYCEGTVTDITSLIMLGLNIDPKTDQNYTSIDYAVYKWGSVFKVFESGVLKGTYGTLQIGDKISVWYEGTTIHYQLNGVDLYTTTVAAGLTLALDTSFYHLNAQLDNIIFNSTKVRTPVNDIGVTDWIDQGIYNPDFGLLLEDAVTNDCVSPSDLSTWTKVNSTINTNVAGIIDVYGTSTADAIVENITNAEHSTYINCGSKAGDISISAEIQAGTRDWVFFHDGYTSGYYFNVATGTLGSKHGIATSGRITPTSGGNYRCEFSVNYAVAKLSYVQISAASSDGVSTYVGIALAEAIYVHNAQLEARGYTTSFTPTSRLTELGNLTFPTPVPAFGGSGFPQSQGSMFLSMVEEQDLAKHGNANDQIITINGGNSLLYNSWGKTFATNDGTAHVNRWAAQQILRGDTVQYGVEWNAVTSLYRLGYRNATTGLPWVWSPWAAYDGAFTDTGMYRFFTTDGSGLAGTVRNNIIRNRVLTNVEWDMYIQS